jgi:hypothetical protein
MIEFTVIRSPRLIWSGSLILASPMLEVIIRTH